MVSRLFCIVSSPHWHLRATLIGVEMEAVVSACLLVINYTGRENVLINYSRRVGVGEGERDVRDGVMKSTHSRVRISCNQLKMVK